MWAKVFDFGPFAFGLEGRDDVEAFAAGGFDEGLEVKIFHQVADFNRARDQAFPRQAGVGIEVDDEAIRSFERVVARTPRMKLEDAHLREADEAFFF